MSDEELEEWCSKTIDRMLADDRFFLHMIIQGFGRRLERLAEAHEENKEVCPNCGFFKDHCVCEKPRTQGDKIRAMSDEELAEFLNTLFIEGQIEAIHEQYPDSVFNWKDSTLKYLKSEVKE